MGADNSKFATEKPAIIKLWIPPMNSAFEFPARRPRELGKKINEVILENDPSGNTTPTKTTSTKTTLSEKTPVDIDISVLENNFIFPKPDQWVVLDASSARIIHRNDVAEGVVINGEYIILHVRTLREQGFDRKQLIEKAKSKFRESGCSQTYSVPDTETCPETPATSRTHSAFGDASLGIEDFTTPMPSQSTRNSDEKILIRLYRDDVSSQPLTVIRVPASWTIHILCYHLNAGSFDRVVEKGEAGSSYKYTCTETLKSLGWGVGGVPMDIYVDSSMIR